MSDEIKQLTLDDIKDAVHQNDGVLCHINLVLSDMNKLYVHFLDGPLEDKMIDLDEYDLLKSYQEV